MSNTTDLVIAAAFGAIGSLTVQWALGGHVAAHHARIQSRYRYRDELKDRLFAVGTAAARLDHEPYSHTIPDDVRRSLLAEDQRAYAIIDRTTAEMVDALAEAAGTYRWPFRDLVTTYVMCARGIVLSARTQRRKAQMLRSASSLMIEVFFGPIWKVPIHAVRLRSISIQLNEHLEQDRVQ